MTTDNVNYREGQAIPEIREVCPTLPSILRKYEKYGRQDYFRGTTSGELQNWQEEARHTLKKLLGLDKMDSCPLSPQWLDTVQFETVTRYHVRYHTEPDITVCAYLLVPTGADGTTPMILCPPGHNGAGKYSVAGCREYSAVEEKIIHYGYDYGWKLALKGYITLCPDIRGFGEMREDPADAGKLPEAIKGDCYWLAHMGEPLGIPVLGMLTWDLMRGIDFLEQTAADGIGDASRIMAFGFSGGGMQALYLSALDQRICGTFIAGYFYGFRDSLLKMNRNCSCNYVPHLMEYYDMGDIASLIAPRPLCIQSCRQDHLSGERGIQNVMEQLDIVRSNYRTAGAAESVRHEIPEGEHHLDQSHIAEDIRWLLAHTIEK